MAKAAGLATGNVSTAELQDATPAALVAHVTSRKCYGPGATSESVRVTLWKKAEKDRLPNSCLTLVPTLRLAVAQKPLLKRQPQVNGREKRCVNRHRRVVIGLVNDAASLNAVTEANQRKTPAWTVC